MPVGRLRLIEQHNFQLATTPLLPIQRLAKAPGRVDTHIDALARSGGYSSASKCQGKQSLIEVKLLDGMWEWFPFPKDGVCEDTPA